MKITELKSMSLIMVLAMMIMTAFTACSDDDNEGNKTVVFPELANISSAAGETTELSFEASADWELSSNAGWCKFQNGEFLESLIYGKAGKQTVTIMTSADGQNYNEDAVAEITLKMGNASQVIYKVTRAKREYADLVVSDEAGNIYDRTHPLTIKGNTATSPVYTVIKAQAESGVKIGFTNPEWLSYVIDEKEGTYQFTFNTANTSGLNPKYPITGNSYTLTFVTEDATTAKTDKVRKVEIPVVYEGLQRDAIGISPTYLNALASVTGKELSDDTGILEQMQSTVTVYNDEFETVIFAATKKINDEGEEEFTYDFNTTVDWLHAVTGTGSNKDKVTVTADTNRETAERAATVMIFPKAVYDEIKGDWAGNLIDESTGDIKASYAGNIMTSITQEGWQEQGERIGFQALFMYAYDYDQTGFRNIKDFFEGTVIKFEDLKNSDGVGDYNVTKNNVWKAIIPKSLLKRFDEVGEPGHGPGKVIFEPVDAATDQEVTEKTSYTDISSEKMAGQAWSQDARKILRISGLGISFDNTSYETYDNNYQLVVKGENDEILALCIVEVYDDTQEGTSF
ncbi:DUF5003 domain-containing protein [Bacteroides stercoris]|jgi:hypothetical protein|uniref:DUF5003 domain-containing protein n=1 Tax=Bacteroides stercoris TaxID=46506 RepID=A0A412E6F3_BACSE|nr:BACON domain-containing carbohydrate-binding protein [Bacteroides stercoris]RGR28276.1 DUF5003 domain-containing protein [Bacteroides stercoris]RGR37637.1 DUF5003 domain-containing protein [Bacteroides stercoris]